METERGVSWSQVYETWRNHFYSLNDDKAKSAFNTFFDLQDFFSEKAPTLGMPLTLGICEKDGHYDVVMALHICEQLLDFFEKRFPEIPLPNLSDLTPKTYQVLERFECISASMLNKYQTKAKKKNKAQAKLCDAKALKDFGHKLVRDKRNVFISIDIEAYEMNHSILLEIGWSMYDARTDKFLDQHYAIDSYKHLTNGKFVDDQKMRFSFGTTVWCSLKQAFKELRKDLDWAVERDGGFILVGHGLDSDIKYLKERKFLWPTAHKSETLEVEESAKIVTLNTDIIYGASINDMHNPPSLGRTLNILNIENWNLHNAGNDAHYTLLLLLKLVE
ncbi:hypothetical protein BDF21DRAFT_438033 [Thamnidium elegans]|uniref:Gfd2/YDR514C-like C-terminal domain-containing protein n=1 Tax=Thamnidium elegans TaxID=101142 RepID=A0A8H7SWQ1_9FUNG|nr:hypothetical protein INT48_009714 [Thamnidium elegans]KAI8083891.1 hypothetical protein BDF21DRAFT_438033 [Thamnidium elegans]